jgi:hypothetical protein
MAQGQSGTHGHPSVSLDAQCKPKPIGPGAPQALKSLQQAQQEMAAARAEAEASRKLAASEASHLESRAASVQAEATVATEQRISLAAKLRDVEQREVRGGFVEEEVGRGEEEEMGPSSR